LYFKLYEEDAIWSCVSWLRVRFKITSATLTVVDLCAVKKEASAFCSDAL